MNKRNRSSSLHLKMPQRKQAEENLRRFELLAAHSRDIVLFMRREDGRILEANAAAVQAYGYSRDEMLTLTIRDLRAPGTLNLTADQMVQADAAGILFETVHRCKDGSTFPVEVSSRGATIGGVRTLVSVVRNITERKLAEEEILKLSKFPAENPYPVLRVQNDGQVTYANAASRELLEVWACEIHGYLPEELRSLIRVAVAHASNRTVDITCNDKVYSLTLVPIAEGGYVNLYGSDITARKRAEGHVQKLNQELSHHATELEFANAELGTIGEKVRLANEELQKEIAEHKRVEEALRQSEERFRFALANSPIIVANLDRQLRYTWVYNPLVGYHAEDLIGEQIGLSADPETKARILRLLEELLTHGGSVQWETTIQTADGAKFFQSQAEPLRTAQGEISGVALVSIDITERKLAEDALRADEERYHAVFDNALDAIVVTDPSGGGAVLSANPAACRLFGYRAEEFHGLSREAMIDSTSPNLPVLLERREHSGKAATELIYKRKDGGTFPGEISSTFYQDKNGERRAVAIIRDITERKEGEEKIRRSEEMLRAVLDQMPSGVTVREAQMGTLILSNARGQEMMGALVDSTNQFAEYHGFHPDGSPYQTEEWPLSRSMDSGEVVRAEEVTYERNDGVRITLSINSAPVRDLQGQIVMGVAVFDDISERKRADGELRRVLEELKVSNAELEQFAYVASHDLQEPLRMVSSYVQLLARRYQGKLDSDADEFIAFAVDGAKRMQNLINDLLTFSRVGTSRKPLVSTSCEDAIGEAVANLQIAIEDSGATITHEPLPEVNGDPTQLVQLFQNLLSNAIKFRGPEPPRIRVDVYQEGAEWVFRLCDNGIGLDPKFADRIFVIFQRLHNRDSYPGTGIGLAICKRIVQRHGGRIWVESTPGEGATFYFTLPIKENT